MWIDSGIDSGNIILSDVVRFTGNEDLSEIHVKVMEHAHDLYLKVVGALEKNPESCPSVPQKSIGPGRVFYNKAWNFRSQMKMLGVLKSGSFKKVINSSGYNELIDQLTLVKLKS
jgi:hypothetical protein